MDETPMPQTNESHEQTGEPSGVSLQAFCIEHDSHRASSLGKPFRVGDYTVATDGRIMVRVPVSLFPSEVNEFSPKEKAIKDFGWDHAELTDWIPIPYLPEPDIKQCRRCMGNGDCTQCGCGTEHECGYCGGEGQITTPIPIPIGAADVSDQYLRKIRALPEVEIARATKWDEPLAFRFKYGLGYLIPMRTERKGGPVSLGEVPNGISVQPLGKSPSSPPTAKEEA